MKQRTAVIVVGLLVVIIGGYVYMTKGAGNQSATPVVPSVAPVTSGAVEFTSTAFYDADGAWYSLKEMTVKKGDTVRVTMTNTKGMHDFVIDEFGVKKDLPLNEPIVIEFIADKAGDFVYYCSKMDHRAKGQWGTLHVTE